MYHSLSGFYSADKHLISYKSIKEPVCITDNDNIIAITGMPKKELIEKPISQDLDKYIEEKRTIILGEGKDKISIPIAVGQEFKSISQVIVPIISRGNAIGSVIIFTRESGMILTDMEGKIAETAATFLGKQMEE